MFDLSKDKYQEIKKLKWMSNRGSGC
ncbi:hypothetical protein EMIT0373P_10569 [Pseudomonas chlororaphis]